MSKEEELKERKRVMNPLTNREISVEIDHLWKLYEPDTLYDDNNRLVLIPFLKRMIEGEEKKHVEGNDFEEDDC